jgi:hypothetical protein
VDQDDQNVRDYGKEASARETRAVAALVKRYYRAGLSGDAVGACKLIYSQVAKRSDFSDLAPEAYAAVSGSSVFRHKTCVEVESVLFELDHRTLAAGAPTVIVTGLRVKGPHGIALLAFKGIPERMIGVERKAGRWRIDALLDSEIP